MDTYSECAVCSCRFCITTPTTTLMHTCKHTRDPFSQRLGAGGGRSSSSRGQHYVLQNSISYVLCAGWWGQHVVYAYMFSFLSHMHNWRLQRPQRQLQQHRCVCVCVHIILRPMPPPNEMTTTMEKTQRVRLKRRTGVPRRNRTRAHRKAHRHVVTCIDLLHRVGRNEKSLAKDRCSEWNALRRLFRQSLRAGRQADENSVVYIYSTMRKVHSICVYYSCVIGVGAHTSSTYIQRCTCACPHDAYALHKHASARVHVCFGWPPPLLLLLLLPSS